MDVDCDHIWSIVLVNKVVHIVRRQIHQPVQLIESNQSIDESDLPQRRVVRGADKGKEASDEKG